LRVAVSGSTVVTTAQHHLHLKMETEPLSVKFSVDKVLLNSHRVCFVVGWLACTHHICFVFQLICCVYELLKCCHFLLYPSLEANSRKKKVYEQQENEENPLRCPVKLYEFYLSKW
jgi:hypothetical protein